LAKYWVQPQVQLAESFGFSGPELNKIAKIVENRRVEIEEAWYEFFKA